MNEQADGPIALIEPPSGYADWLAELKTRIHTAQQRAALAVNRELVLLYWQIGHDILERQAKQGWGAKVIARLAHDLRTAFPGNAPGLCATHHPAWLVAQRAEYPHRNPAAGARRPGRH